MSHKLVLTSVDVWKLHCFPRQRRRLSWMVIHSAEQLAGGGGWFVVGGATILAACADKHLRTNAVWDLTLYILVDTFLNKRRCATYRRVAGSIPAAVIGIFN
jgi:hypothetical protein